MVAICAKALPTPALLTEVTVEAVVITMEVVVAAIANHHLAGAAIPPGAAILQKAERVHHRAMVEMEEAAVLLSLRAEAVLQAEAAMAMMTKIKTIKTKIKQKMQTKRDNAKRRKRKRKAVPETLRAVVMMMTTARHHPPPALRVLTR